MCDNILYTLLNEKDRSKDHLKARLDLKAMELWPIDEGNTCPTALHTLGKQEIEIILKTLKEIIVHDGFSSNISRCVDVEHQKVIGLKTHDCHILMHELLPLAIQNVLPAQACSVLVEFFSCLKQLCAKVVHMDGLDKLQERIVVALCRLEMLFPPSFFTVMVHLVVHLVEEVNTVDQYTIDGCIPLKGTNKSLLFS